MLESAVARRVVPMEVRLAIAAFAAVADGTSVTAACARLGISRDTFYRYRQRLADEGATGVLPRSSRPRSSPETTPAEVVAMIVAEHDRLRREGWDHGARSIQARLERAGVAVPSARTVHRVLVREGLIAPEPAKRPRSSYRRFEHPAPNACWQLDGTQWSLTQGNPVCILRLIDDHSRLILATRAAPGETTEAAWALMETAMARHGRPVLLLSDGGSAFTSRRTSGGISVFEQRLREHGINPVVSSPAHPQTCGKKERDWQPLKRWLAAHPAAADLAGLQRLLDAYDVLFNTDRPHQGLNGQTPDERYTASPKAVPEPGPRPAPPTTSQHQVRASGVVDLGNRYSVLLGHQWTGATVTVVRDNLDVAILHDATIIKRLTIDPTRKTQPSGLKRGRPRKPLPSETSRHTCPTRPVT
ncbi:MAG: transposase [Propionibacteriaceae bacterium]|nr:MAG: transposase [Propionibacteriaceae bacterium]